MNLAEKVDAAVKKLEAADAAEHMTTSETLLIAAHREIDRFKAALAHRDATIAELIERHARTVPVHIPPVHYSKCPACGFYDSSGDIFSCLDATVSISEAHRCHSALKGIGPVRFPLATQHDVFADSRVDLARHNICPTCRYQAAPQHGSPVSTYDCSKTDNLTKAHRERQLVRG